ncbi:MAG: Omp28-related outer membrane protein [Bacteroidales bacterium]
MKKTLLSLLAVVFTLSVYAQLPVDTTAQNKNVILEEFTGINCPYCPDGHRVANEIQALNPGDMYVINIHVGGYATPSGGQPDYRTSFGSAIDGQAGVAGYPAGTVNRHQFSGMSQGGGTAMSRGDWNTAADQILTEASYANVALDAEIDLQTREMTVDVELYFTGNTAPSSVNLNVAVNQNNVAGPQSGGASYNPSQMLPNGDYNHMHMLRHLITGQWGEVIDTTAYGTLIQRQYTWTIPADINGVAVEMSDLEVIGFIAEGQQEIITGDKAAMNYVTPPGVDIADLTVKPASTMPGWCDNSIVPEVKVINNGTNPVDTFRVGYDLNGNGFTYQEVTSALPVGDSTVISFQSVSLPEGENVLTVNANVDSTAHLLEMSIGDNTDVMPPIYILPANAFASSLWEDFENYSAMDSQIDNSLYMGEGGAFVLDNTAINGVDWPIGAYEKSQSAYFFYFFNLQSGTEEQLVWEKLDFSNNSNTKIRFDYAYAQYASENDKLKIEASSDCGNTWTTVYEKAGSSLATAPASTDLFVPAEADWDSDTIDLSAMDGQSEVLVSVKGISDYGNNLLIDNLVIFDDNTSSLNENTNVDKITVYPNPADHFVNVDLSLTNDVNVEVRLINQMGQIVLSNLEGHMTAGQHQMKLNTNNLAAGIYNLQIITGNKVSVERISIVK